MTIWKFNLTDKDDDFVISIPHTHRILSVGEQDGHIVMWALVDPNAPTMKKQMTVVGTGWQGYVMDGILSKRFVGTVQMPDGLVFHVFE